MSRNGLVVSRIVSTGNGVVKHRNVSEGNGVEWSWMRSKGMVMPRIGVELSVWSSTAMAQCGRDVIRSGIVLPGVA